MRFKHTENHSITSGRKIYSIVVDAIFYFFEWENRLSIWMLPSYSIKHIIVRTTAKHNSIAMSSLDQLT